jgi:5-methylthioadenosine/S-adenosylhomocysteine deaminase
MYYFTPTIAEVCKQMGIRALLGQAVLDFKAPDFDTPVQAIEATKELINSTVQNSCVQIIPAPHSPYTCNAGILQQCRKLANEYNVPLHIHVSETIVEYNTSLATHNLTRCIIE